MEMSEDQVRQSLHILEDLALVTPTRDSRVPKYEHRIRTVLNLRRDETAVICLLLLRGPQTPGELRSRSDRMFAFDDLPAVQATLDRLAGRVVGEAVGGRPVSEGPLVVMLARQPGSSVNRWTHLLGGIPEPRVHPDPTRLAIFAEAGEGAGQLTVRVSELEATVSRLEREIAGLRALWGK